MSALTLLWSITATVALTTATFCALAWFVDRRDLFYPMFCLAAIGTAVSAPLELGMMQATTTAAYGEWLRWYHLPIFFVLVGQLLFVHFYLGTGRLWLLWLIIGVRSFVLVADFAVDPNYNFRAIVSLREAVLFGQRVSVVGESVGREWQWLAAGSSVLLVLFILDATIQRWRKGGSEARRRAMMVGLALALPMTCNLVISQLVAFGVLHTPLSATLWFLGALVIASFELGREFVASRRVRLQLAELRGELAQLERVNTLGQLATGLAHELVQPLSAVRLNVEAAQRRLQNADPDVKALREIVADIRADNNRAVEVIERMRALFKRGTVAAQPLSLQELVRDVVALVRQEAVARNVTIECSLLPGLPHVLGDRVNVSQVLLNLIVNAMNAVESRPADVRRVLVEARIGAHGGMETAVKDSGPGVPPEDLEHVFDPHFTTKSGGLGVGLSLSRAIIEAHGGRLWATNGAAGAVFCFTLPLA
ncbi:MAG TPA: ATP-binding protein [Gammaproteobacteria bacterium]|nr:ATP-binding protein [Gammaproteobacteria bacterium]